MRVLPHGPTEAVVLSRTRPIAYRALQQPILTGPSKELCPGARKPCFRACQIIHESLRSSNVESASSIPPKHEPERAVDFNSSLPTSASPSAFVKNCDRIVHLGVRQSCCLTNIAGSGAEDSRVRGERREFREAVASHDVEPLRVTRVSEFREHGDATVQLVSDGFCHVPAVVTRQLF